LPNIKPVSDLRNYNEVLRDVAAGEPVFLTKNGRGRYALMDMADYEKTQAALKLMSQLAEGEKSGYEKGWLSMVKAEPDKGRRSGEKGGWIPADEARARFEERYRGRRQLFGRGYKGERNA
jgi:prevent-host-death family protein